MLRSFGKPFVFAATLMCVLVLPVHAMGQVGRRNEAPLVQASLIADTTHFVPGQLHRLGVVLTMREGWHTYWVNPGDTGVATKITITLPDGIEAGEVRWPVPERYVHGDGELLDYVYSGTVVLQVPVYVREDVDVAQQMTMGVEVEWLVCQESCVPGDASIELTLPARDDAPGVLESSASLFEASDARMTLPASKAKGLQIDWKKNVLRVRAPGAQRVRVFAKEPSFPSPVDAIESGERNGESVTLTYPVSLKPGTIVRAVVEIEGGSSAGAYDIIVGGDPRLRNQLYQEQD